jgi:hypothetical protein
MPKKSFKSANPLKTPPPPPRVEVRDQTGMLLPVNEVIIEKDAKGILLIRVKVEIPARPSYSGSGTFYDYNYSTTSF